MTADLPAILAAFAVIAVAPGPANLTVGLVAMARGLRGAVPTALGLTVGLALWGGVAALGLGAILATSETALFALRLVGGAYLLWLAAQSARVVFDPDGDRASAASGFRRGLLLNLSNPKAVIAWMAALSMGLTPDAGAGAVAGVTLLCVALGLVNYLGWAAAFSRPVARRLYSRARRWVDGAAAALLGLAGLALLRDALRRA